MIASTRRAAVAALAALGLLGCASIGGPSARPNWLTIVSETRMDGQSNDLLTAGLGLGPFIGQGAAPTYADPLKPTAAELRRAAIFSRLDVAGGATRLFGPNIDPATKQPVADARVAGEEILAYASDPGVGHFSAAMLLQIPASFDAAQPCIVAVPATGSARLYADLLRVGGWGLRRNCAVVYTDKGQGNGVHDLASNTVNLATGERADAKAAAGASHFSAPMSDAAREAFLKDKPYRVAFKHAHSRRNADATWGRDVLRAIEFAFYALNQRHGGKLTRENTTVIVEGNSNGGGAALLAGEADRDGWIDGIVAAQPQVQPEANDQVVVERAGKQWRGGGRSLVDYFTETILYQPCAAMATPQAWRTGEISVRLQPLHVAEGKRPVEFGHAQRAGRGSSRAPARAWVSSRTATIRLHSISSSHQAPPPTSTPTRKATSASKTSCAAIRSRPPTPAASRAQRPTPTWRPSSSPVPAVRRRARST